MTADSRRLPAGTGVDAILFDLLMAVMNSMAAWADAAADETAGLAWRDSVTRRMVEIERYVPYEELVEAAAAERGLPPSAPGRLWKTWRRMEPWPDAAALVSLTTPYGFVTNCSHALAERAAARSHLRPRVILSAEEAGWYKPRPEVYRLACQRIGSRPERTLFVAGAAYDAVGALAAGLHACVVVRRPPPAGLDSRIRVLTGLDDLAEAAARG